MDGTTTPAIPVKSQAQDYVAAGVKAALSLVPLAGPFLAEIAGSIIPRQRVDRLADFSIQLNERIKELEENRIAAKLNDEEFTDLIEEAIRQAARSTTEERRRYLASLVANSLTSEAIEHAESKYILRILGELNDVEVLWLRSYTKDEMRQGESFCEIHKNVLARRIAFIGCPQEDVDKHALQESYTKHLVQLGLVDNHISKSRDGNPEFDTFTGELKVSYRHTSSLGRLLLRNIGMLAD